MSYRVCRYGDRCNRSSCYFLHPPTSIRPILCKYGDQCQRNNCTYLHQTSSLTTSSYNPSDDDSSTNSDYNSSQRSIAACIIKSIHKLFSSAKEQQREFHLDEDDPDSENETIDHVEMNVLNELKLQENEFKSIIRHLTTKFNSLLASTSDGLYNVEQLQQIKKQLERELKHWQSRLPIYARRSEIIDKVTKNQVLILKADTGSGKSTQTVQYLCDAHFTDHRQIICTQPRKLAVRSLAARVAEEYGCKIGEEIGYQVGGDRLVVSHQTKVKFVTDTLFLNDYNKDRSLHRYSIVIVDEAHERKIDTDIVFGIMKRCLKTRKDLKLIIMSATLDIDLLYKYFAQDFQCDILEVGGRTYPIEDTYLDEDVENYVQASVTKAIEIHRSDELGDILVFLTGQDEIDEALADLNQRLDKDRTYIGLPLHGKLSEEENVRIFEKISNIRKIIFSTNVAETSVTIDGIKHVIDSGMVKEKMWDDKRKMQILKIGQITKSSVKQRRGRAGRTSAGKCYHLYTIDTYEAMDNCSRAEILCTQPTIAILKLKHLNIDNIESFEWLESPSNSNIHEAYQTLIWLNALNSQGQLTKLGRNMAQLNIDPKLTAMLCKAEELDCLFYALILAGMLTVSQNIWWTNKDQKSKDIATNIRAQLSHPTGDHLTLINLYLKWNGFCLENKTKKQQSEWCKTHSVSSKALQMAQEFIREKSKQMNYRFDFRQNQFDFNDDLVFRLLQCITTGHFLNLAISNGPLRAGYQVISPFSSSTNEPIIARVFRTSTLCFNDQMPRFILFNELVNLNGTNYMTILSSIELDWLKTVSQQWFQTINGENLHAISYENYRFENIGSTLLRAFVGKRYCHLNMLEEATQSIIDVDYKQARLTIWARQINLENVKKIVEKRIEEERQKLLIEAEEMQIVGRTRILMASGGVSQLVLVEDEFIRIILTKLPSTITQERIDELCKPFGQIRKIDFLRSNHEGACAAVTYTTVDEARLACSQLDHHLEQDRKIAVTGSYLKRDAMIGKQNYRLKAIWYLTQGRGTAMITFSQVKSAVDACQVFKRLNYQCHYERSTDLPTLKIVYYIGTSRQKAFVHFQTYDQAIDVVAKLHTSLSVRLAQNQFARPGSVLFQGFSKDLDEEDVREHFRDYPGVTDVQILRGYPGQRFEKPHSAEEEVRELFSRYRSFQPDTITFNSKIVNGKLEAYVEFLDINDLKQAIEDLNGEIGHLGCGKVRVSERILPKRNNVKKTKENEYVIRFHNLNKTHDKYDFIKILKENQLYDDVKNVIVFRQKPDHLKNSIDDVNEFFKEEQQAGLDELRSMFKEEEKSFNSLPDCQILSCYSNGTVTAVVLFNDPIDILTAVQTLDSRFIGSIFRISKLRLVPSITHEIFLNATLTRVIPEKIEQAIQRVRERFRRVIIKALPSKNTDKASTTKILIDSDDLQQVTLAKIEFDNLMKGFEYKSPDHSDSIKLLFDRIGTATLQKIENETGTYIWSNHSSFSIRIYGNDRAVVNAQRRIDKYVEEILKNKKYTIILDIPSGHIRQVLRRSDNYQTMFGTKLNVEISTIVAERQIQISGKEEDVLKCEELIKHEWSTMLKKENPSMNNTNECPICCSKANYALQTCGHKYCFDCLRQQLTTKFDTTLSNESLRIRCMMTNCDSILLLRDIKTIIDSANMRKLARASFQAYLKSDEDIVQCMGIDCKQVYRKSKHPQSYFCDSCCKMYCIRCEVEYHTGLTCDAYQILLKWKQEEPIATNNIGNLGYQTCPSCKQIIDRYDGCNAVKCNCGISFCWLCRKTDPIDIHRHFADTYSTCYQKMFWTRENNRLD